MSNAQASCAGTTASIPDIRGAAFQSSIDDSILYRRSGIVVKMFRLRTIALTCSCLLVIPFLSYAQSSDPATSSSQDAQKPAAPQDQKATPESQDKPQPGSQQPTKEPSSDLPNAPSSTKTEPSLEDLGFTASQAQGDAKRQALLDKRT